MCFTPKVSFITAAIEFFTGAYIYFTAKRTTAVKILVIFLYALGMYQFSEFMLCSTEQKMLWAKIGFLSYHLLPALGLDFVVHITRNKPSPLWLSFLIYLPTIVFGIFALLAPNFIAEASCGTFFVTIKHLFYREIGGIVLMTIYWWYYFGYIAISSILLLLALNQKHEKAWHNIYLYTLLAVLLSLLPAFIFIVVLPSLRVIFPSVYCHFALLFALLALIGVRKNPKFLKK
ncbi:MAG: hypothetical protein WC882_04915 [Candidatus Gracilibacteria bacterium]